MPLFPLNFLLALGDREQPYGMSTTIMADLHHNTLTYIDNVMTLVSPINLYLTL